MHAAEFGTIYWDYFKAVLPRGDLSISTRRWCSIFVQVYEYQLSIESIGSRVNLFLALLTHGRLGDRDVGSGRHATRI